MDPFIAETSFSAPIRRLCLAAGIPRSSYYRRQQRKSLDAQPDLLQCEIERICQEYRGYGYRRVTRELHRRGHQVNHKRILALMRKGNLLCRPKRRFIRTTDSRHGYPIYPNLTHAMTVTGPNQLWVADLTYIRLVKGFAYLAAIVDVFSRRAIGWALSSHIDTKLALGALQMALRTRSIRLGLVHHSDQGVQYASSEYVALLVSKNITISMSRKGNPYDNALAESFIKTLKVEEVYLNEYETLLDARTNIEHFIDKVYNHKRLHSSLAYKPPVEFEADYFKNQSTLAGLKTVSA